MHIVRKRDTRNSFSNGLTWNLQCSITSHSTVNLQATYLCLLHQHIQLRTVINHHCHGVLCMHNCTPCWHHDPLLLPLGFKHVEGVLQSDSWRCLQGCSSEAPPVSSHCNRADAELFMCQPHDCQRCNFCLHRNGGGLLLKTLPLHCRQQNGEGRDVAHAS